METKKIGKGSSKTEWTYPMTINYRSNWSEWEAIREIVQNMMDSDSNFSIKQTTEGLLLRDSGKGIKKKHLLLGVSEKSSGARGQFGEGLKLALVVLKRLGYKIRIKSHNLAINVSTTSIEGETCLKLILDEAPNNATGTEILIGGYTGNTFTEHFVNGNKRVIYNCDHGQIINEQPTKLYVKDIYVCKLHNALYSYNLKNIQLSEDRNIPSEYSVQQGLGRLYSTLKGKHLHLAVRFLQGIKNDTYEAKVDLPYRLEQHKVWKHAFAEVFGSDAVIRTSDRWEKEATWVGANPVQLPNEIANSLAYIISTDKQFANKHQSQLRQRVRQKTLPSNEKSNFNILKKLAKAISPATRVYVYNQTDPACYDPNKDIIIINQPELQDLKKCIGHLVHELAHSKGASDMTAEMIHKLGNVSGDIIYALITKDIKIRKPTTHKTTEAQ